MKALVVAVLIILIAIIGVSPDLHLPGGVLHRMGLDAFQLAVIAAAGALMVVILLLISQSNLFWRSFIHPPDCRGSARMTARYCGFVLAGGMVLLIGIFVVSFYYFGINESPPRPILVMTGWAPNILALTVVGEIIGLVRLLILNSKRPSRVT